MGSLTPGWDSSRYSGVPPKGYNEGDECETGSPRHHLLSPRAKQKYLSRQSAPAALDPLDSLAAHGTGRGLASKNSGQAPLTPSHSLDRTHVQGGDAWWRRMDSAALNEVLDEHGRVWAKGSYKPQHEQARIAVEQQCPDGPDGDSTEGVHWYSAMEGNHHAAAPVGTAH